MAVPREAVLEGTAGLPNSPNCSCSTTKQGDCSGMCHFLQVGVTLDLSTSGTDVLGVVTQNCVTYHNNHAGYKTPGHASTGPGSTLEWTLRANVVFQTGNSEVGGAASGLDHGFYTHANRGLVLDGNVGYDIAGWGIHAYAGGPGSNGTVFTRNLFFRCETGAFLTCVYKYLELPRELLAPMTIEGLARYAYASVRQAKALSISAAFAAGGGDGRVEILCLPHRQAADWGWVGDATQRHLLFIAASRYKKRLRLLVEDLRGEVREIRR